MGKIEAGKMQGGKMQGGEMDAGGGVLRLVLGDQLSPSLSALRGAVPGRDTILMAEVRSECDYAPHHAQKLVLVLSAMRHFAARLRAQGFTLRYVRLDDPQNSGSIAGEVMRAAAELRPAKVVATEPAEWRLREALRAIPAPATPALLEDGRFLCSHAEFAAHARGRRTLRMEYFYREMRRRHGVLMDGGEPCGGAWNFDQENRKALPRGQAVPRPRHFAPDPITAEVIALVRQHFPGRIGEPGDFAWPVTQEDAELALQDFLDHRLASFGTWQDAMAAGQPFMFHALISSALNLGLLDARDIIARAEAAYRRGAAALNAVEGFIRQILGWREFIRGVYWQHMPGYAARNALAARRHLPAFYWTGETDMRCMAEAIGQTIRHAYAHHIQRLMITGNFALLAGLDPDQVDQWYLAVYADAYEWVEMPNTRGMALFADGGIVGSKPYAASGAYINRMSDYCRGCAYDVTKQIGPRACPFNFLYWDFMARHEALFARNPRMSLPLRNLARMDPARRAAIAAQAEKFRAELG